MKKCVTAVIVGCGHRSRIYASYAITNPEELKIVALVDPDKKVRELTRKMFNVDEKMCFDYVEDILPFGRIADAVINGTMDNLHIETSIPLLKLGYDMLLEKPITNNEKELLELEKVAKEYGNKLMICHVLRYSRFYQKAKEIVDSGEIGEIVNVETQERVGVAHNTISYVRGKWNNEELCGSTMLLAKCCHDIDLICWFNNKTRPYKVSSFGGRNFIIPEKAPKEAGTRCIVDCPLVDTCQYSAKLMHLDSDYLGAYPWQCTGKEWNEITKEEKIESLSTNNPNGECAYKANANVVDHQVVNIEFENGSTATHSMLCGSQRAGRSLYIMGTKGEIEGWVGSGLLYIRTFAVGNPDLIDKGIERVINFNNLDQSEMGGHFGGDEILSEDFVRYIRGEAKSISCTSIEDSINGHLVVYAADRSRVNGTIEYINKR